MIHSDAMPVAQVALSRLRVARLEQAFGNIHAGISRCTITSWVHERSFLSRSRRSATESVVPPSSFCWSTLPVETGGFFLREPLRDGYRIAKPRSARPWRRRGQLV